MIEPEQVRERLALVEARIRAAGGTGVDVLAVTKGFGPDAIDAAIGAGCLRIGENYAQELLDKLHRRAESPVSSELHVTPEIHFIGRLQSNKVRSLGGVVESTRPSIGQSLVDAPRSRTLGPGCWYKSTRPVSRARVGVGLPMSRTWSPPPWTPGCASKA